MKFDPQEALLNIFGEEARRSKTAKLADVVPPGAGAGGLSKTSKIHAPAMPFRSYR